MYLHCNVIMVSIAFISTAMIPVRFNPSDYSVTEGVDSNAVITLEALAAHLDFAFTVTVLTQNGSAIGESCHLSYTLFYYPLECVRLWWS